MGVFHLMAKMSNVVQAKEGEPLASLEMPALICSDREKHNNFENLPGVKTAVYQEFSQLFEVQAAAHRLDRASKKFPEDSDVNKALTQRLNDIMPGSPTTTCPKI